MTSVIACSVTMMIREHFEQCSAIPEETKKHFRYLKAKKKYGDINSRQYWDYSAARLGLVENNTDPQRKGVVITEKSMAAASRMPINTR